MLEENRSNELMAKGSSAMQGCFTVNGLRIRSSAVAEEKFRRIHTPSRGCKVERGGALVIDKTYICACLKKSRHEGSMASRCSPMQGSVSTIVSYVWASATIKKCCHQREMSKSGGIMQCRVTARVGEVQVVRR